jgi:threonine/homoserine/homoserine lactone efflux protein
MMTFNLLLALSSFAFVSSITPGPNNLMLMTSGTNFGFRRTLPHLAGVCIGFSGMMVLVGLGVADLIEEVPYALTVLRVASVSYLLFLAWKLASSVPTDLESAGADGRKPITFLQAMLFQWVNPKAWAMSLTAVSAYTSKADPVGSVLLVALVFAAVGTPCSISWTALGVRLRGLLAQQAKLRAFNVGAALILVGSIYPMLS